MLHSGAAHHQTAADVPGSQEAELLSLEAAEDVLEVDECTVCCRQGAPQCNSTMAQGKGSPLPCVQQCLAVPLGYQAKST